MIFNVGAYIYIFYFIESKEQKGRQIKGRDWLSDQVTLTILYCNDIIYSNTVVLVLSLLFKGREKRGGAKNINKLKENKKCG